jgi:protein-disulfide isomerase
MASAPKVSSFEKFLPAMMVVMVLLAFAVGILWQKVQGLEKGTVSGATTNATGAAAAATPNTPKVSMDTIKGLFDKDILKFGDNSKKVLFVEVADPSCPYCSIAGGLNSDLNNSSAQFKLVKDGGSYVAPVPEMKKLVDEGKASFTYIYYPGHGNGEMGMKALYCANEKGKFWEAYDLIMNTKGYDLLNNQIKNDKSKSGDMANYLKSVVDSSFIKSCLDSGKYDSRLSSDSQLATSLGVQGTPGFFVNDLNYAGAYSFTDMQSAVSSALK